MSTDNGAWRETEQNSGQENSAACNFKPDYELSTPRARDWAANSDKQRATPLDLNENGEYKVKWGDSLSTIAERALKGSGAPVSKDSLQAMQDAIVEANHDRYKTLDCNRDFVKENWCLKIPGARNEQPEPPVRVEPPITYEPPVRVQPLPEPDYPVRRPCPPEQRPMPLPPRDYNDCPPRMPGIINEPGGVINIFIGGGNRQREQHDQWNRNDQGRDWGRERDWGRQRDWGQDRDMYQWNDMPRGCHRQQEIPYRPEYYHEPYRREPEGCSPCERRQYHHNQRMPQVLRRNPSYPR